VIDQPDSGPASSIATCSRWDCRNAAATEPQVMARARAVRAAKTIIVIRRPCFSFSDKRQIACGWVAALLIAPHDNDLHHQIPHKNTLLDRRAASTTYLALMSSRLPINLSSLRKSIPR
jgi:hypothetical protein